MIMLFRFFYSFIQITSMVMGMIMLITMRAYFRYSYYGGRGNREITTSHYEAITLDKELNPTFSVSLGLRNTNYGYKRHINNNANKKLTEGGACGVRCLISAVSCG